MRANVLIPAVLIIACTLFMPFGCNEENSKLIAEPTPAKPKKNQAKPNVEKKQQTASIKKTEPVSDVNLGPRIKFEKTIHDFGEVGPGTRNVCEFKFTNTGDKPLKVNKKIQTTCGCTVPRLSKELYAPGETGTVKITYSASRATGRKSRSVYVLSNDKKSPKVKLSVSANIVKKADFEPKRLNLLLDKENANCPPITIRSLDGKAFSIEKFKSTGNAITADVNSSIKAAKIVLQPKVDIQKLRKNLKGSVDINLTHPQNRVINIPFSAKPDFKVTPKSIVITNAKAKKSIKRDIWVINNYNKDFEIESTSSQKGSIKVLKKRSFDKHRYKLTLQITPLPATEDKQRIFTETFYVKIKNGEKLTIKVRGFYSNK